MRIEVPEPRIIGQQNQHSTRKKPETETPTIVTDAVNLEAVEEKNTAGRRPAAHKTAKNREEVSTRTTTSSQTKSLICNKVFILSAG